MKQDYSQAWRLVGRRIDGRRVTGVKIYHAWGEPRFVIKTEDGKSRDVDRLGLAEIEDQAPKAWTARWPHLYCGCVHCDSEKLGYQRGFDETEDWRGVWEDEKRRIPEAFLKAEKRKHEKFLAEEQYLSVALIPDPVTGEEHPTTVNFHGVPCKVFERWALNAWIQSTEQEKK